MKERLEERLATLKAEFESGQGMLAELEAKQAHLKESMLRISGAVQVLEEELAEEARASSAQNGQAEPEAEAVAS